MHGCDALQHTPAGCVVLGFMHRRLLTFYMPSRICRVLNMSPLHALLQGGGRAGSQATERRRFLESLARCCQVREQ